MDELIPYEGQPSGKELPVFSREVYLADFYSRTSNLKKVNVNSIKKVPVPRNVKKKM
ncbi:hypothetical protein J4442_05000 [Candidatus Woesearchaeota archaeon]|nr:hypothetical protein [Candidatus Woesearchaeota archaeon]